MKKEKNNYNLANITREIINSGFIIFDNRTLKSIFKIKNNNTFFPILRKMVNNKIIVKLERNKYMLNNGNVDSFYIANAIYSQSYISFETALNFYGILSQFPYEITSATTKKTIQKNINGFTYSYTHIKRNLFFGYEKKNNILIAEPEKALLDQIYISLRGFKKINLDEYDFSRIKKIKLKEYFDKYPKMKQTIKMRHIINEILKYAK